MKARALALCGAALLAGCGGAMRYAEVAAKNLHIRTETSSGSAFTGVKAVLGVQAATRVRHLIAEMVCRGREKQAVCIPLLRVSTLVRRPAKVYSSND